MAIRLVARRSRSLELDRAMADPLGMEERLQLTFHAGHLLQTIDHHMKRRRVLGRADGPDMQVMPPPQGRHGIEPRPQPFQIERLSRSRLKVETRITTAIARLTAVSTHAQPV